MVGMAVADSIGHMFEFLPVCGSGSRFDPETLECIGVLNRFRLKNGQWTDDTSMGLCLSDSLLVREGYDGADMRVRFWNWWFRGYNNAFRLDPKRSKSVGLGGNISASLFDITDAQPKPRFEAVGEDAGNGSLMRLAPVPIYFHGNLNLATRASAESSYTTHPGSIAADACAFLGFLIAAAIARDPASWDTAKEFLDSCVSTYCDRLDPDAQPALRKLLKGEEPVGSKERCWNWRDPAGLFIEETLQIRGDTYNGYPVSAGYFGAYSMDGLAIALHSFYHTSSFMAAIARCVNFLGDADSTGAICGQLAGAFYGVTAVDVRSIAELERWDGGEIALRGALLFALGRELSAQPEMLERAERSFTTSTDEEERPLLAGGATLRPRKRLRTKGPPAVL